MIDERVADLIEAQDFNGLLRVVDDLCATREWDDLLELADRCEHAVERGKQLWPISEHIDYRVALEAPGPYAADVLVPGSGRFALGPLTEVAASTHTWAELALHIELPQVAAFVAQERVLRGEVLDGDARAHAEILELPLHLESWEPTYALATYRADHVEVAEPWEPQSPLVSTEPRPGAGELDREAVVDALLDLVTPWTSESNGAARAVAVEGGAVEAASALSFAELRIGALEPDEALSLVAWTAASGGAHGRRRGAALGRSLAWFTVLTVADRAWPAAPQDVHDAVRGVRWFRWDEGAPEKGWVLRLAVEDPDGGWAAALAATDVLEEVEN